ncbi:FG-GAP-like repeat-containing protein [Streptomyces sp. NPDC057854]|uniref:FG-GAP repeat domain-containing protein n=1 Tax=unclassified Streptomyces TaxID=2593676 RepID=UPI003681356F
MSVRRTVALALSATLALTGLAATTGPAAMAADTAPYSVTIDPSTAPHLTPSTSVLGVGTGVQLSNSLQSRWKRLSDGRVAHSPTCEAEFPSPYGYGDVFVCPGSYGGDAVVHDFATGRTTTVSNDSGDEWFPLVGRQQLVQAVRGTGGVTLRFLGYGDNAPADREVFLPGADAEPRVLAQDGTSAILAYDAGEERTVGLLGLAEGTISPLPKPSFAGGVVSAALGKDRIVLAGPAGTPEVSVVSRTDPAAPGRSLALPRDIADSGGAPRLVGEWIVDRVDLPMTEYGKIPADLWAVPLDGGAPRDLGITVDDQLSSVMPGTDGHLYTVGSTPAGLAGAYRIAPATDGTPAVTRVFALGAPYPGENVTLSHGRLVAQGSDAATELRLRGYDLALTGTHAATARWNCDATVSAANCPDLLAGAIYPDAWTDTGDGRLVTLEQVGRPGCSDCAVAVHVTTPGSGGATRSVLVKHASGLQVFQMVRASGRYVHFYATAGSTDRSIVADIETGTVLRDSANLNQSLWGGQLWTGSGTNGTVSAVDVRTGATVATADLGTSCVFGPLQVVGKWIMRSCASNSRKVVVHDREKRQSVWADLPSSSEPQLGDGFLAYDVTGSFTSLYTEDVRSGTSQWRQLGELSPQYDDVEGRRWTVDRFGGGVAFLDPWQSFRVEGLGGVTSRLAAIDADTPAANIKAGAWKPRWWLSKPGASWSLSLKHKISGKVVRTLAGGEARGIVAPSWDGKDASGKYVANGVYVWTLTVKPADGHGADLVVSGAVGVTGAAAVRRDMAGDDGFGDLLVMDTAGAMSLYRGTGTGAVSARIAGVGNKFATTSLFVPVGDLNGDRCADVYARVGDQLRAYRPGCGKVLTASSPYTLVGSGWGGYDVLTSSGDVNGDGYADLVARQASRGDVYFYGGTATHALKARVRIGTNWKLYKKIVGAGDLNGDGRGDLLGLDSAGVLWRYYGTSTGGVTARVKVGGGWGGYSALVGVGDLSGDGRADLLARDTAGKLWRYASTGAGTYGTRVLVGSSGWNGFKGLF